MAETDIDKANLEIARLTEALGTSKSSLDTLTTSHNSVVEQHEASKASLSNSEAQIKQLTDASKISVKGLEDLTKQLGERDSTIATHVESLSEFETLRTTYSKLQEEILIAQKARLTAAGIGDELLKDKDSAALTLMEDTIKLVAKPANGTINPTGTGLTGGGNSEIPANGAGLGPLDDELSAIKKAKDKAGIKSS